MMLSVGKRTSIPAVARGATVLTDWPPCTNPTLTVVPRS